MTKRCPRVVKLVMGLYYRSLKVMEFVMKLYHGNVKESEARLEALPHRFQHPYEVVNSWSHKRDK